MVRFFVRFVLPLVIVVAITMNVLHVSAGVAWVIVLVVGGAATILLVRHQATVRTAREQADTEWLAEQQRRAGDFGYLFANKVWEQALLVTKNVADVAMARADDEGVAAALEDARSLVNADSGPDTIRKADVLVRKMERWQRQRAKVTA